LIEISAIITASLETEEQRITAETLFETYKNLMYHTAYRVLKDPHDAEDAVADTLVKVCRNISKFCGESEKSQKLLLYEYTRNTAIDRYRERSRKTCVSLNEVLTADDPDSDPFDAVLMEDFGDMQTALAKLPQKYKDLLIMRYGEGLKYKEIAALTHIPEATVATRLLRAKAMLLKLYETEGKRR